MKTGIGNQLKFTGVANLRVISKAQQATIKLSQLSLD